jgi:hypothetical protein
VRRALRLLGSFDRFVVIEQDGSKVRARLLPGF